jgi:hypothetical protein
MKKIFSLIMLVFAGLYFAGCIFDSPEPCKPCPPPQVTIQYKTQYVDRPVPCPDQNVTCNFKGEGYTPTQRLLECVVLQKRALEVCYGTSYVNNVATPDLGSLIIKK